MVVNVELLTKVRDKIASEPDTLDMDHWVNVATEGLSDENDYFLGADDLPCGTTACIAGWAILFSGDRVHVPAPMTARRFYDAMTVVPPDTRNARDAYGSISDRAAELLGLRDDVASWLFVIDDEDVVWALDHLIAGHGDDEALFDKVYSEQCARAQARYAARTGSIPTEVDDGQ